MECCWEIHDPVTSLASQPCPTICFQGPPISFVSFSLYRGSETDGRDQTVVLEECNQEGEPGTTTNSPSSASQEVSVELTVPI